MYFYEYFSGFNAGILGIILRANDPFSLSPDEILDRVLSAGYGPFVQQPREEPWRLTGAVTEVRRDEQTFIVAVCQDLQTIAVQEVRAAVYDIGAAHLTPVYQKHWV